MAKQCRMKLPKIKALGDCSLSSQKYAFILKD